MIRYLDEHRERFGVEPICRVLGATEGGFITSRGYRAAKTRPRSVRAVRDELLGAVVRLHAENYGVYGVRKMHALMKRQGWDLGRDQTGRIMRQHGLRGVKRSKRVFTTYVRTWQGFAYVAFVTDAFSRRIVGWNVAQTLKADILPLQALEMAAFQHGGDLAGVTHHSDHGSNYMAMVYTDG